MKTLTTDFDTNLDADVLVIGGGAAGTWAAWSAACQGASVVLVDKGYCGTTGCAAASGNGVWYVPPEPAARLEAMVSRESLGGFLADRRWMSRVLDRTYTNINLLTEWGYPFPVDKDGEPIRCSLQGPDYMRLMRKHIKRAGVRVLDHSPALELLVDDDSAVGGARGVHRQTSGKWTVRSHSTIIATGGCAFLSKALGCNVLTGDGYLMAAEAGAEMSGMEFSNAYGISPAFSSVTKTLFYNWATFTYLDGTVIAGAGSQKGRSVIAKTLLDQPVYAILDKATEKMQSSMRLSQPNFFLPFDRTGIDPFTQRFEITLRLEGTVRGTGGIRIIDDNCATSIAGLYAAGDAATREYICGAFTGGGSHNAAWAISSGYWSGEAAAEYALRLSYGTNRRRLKGVGTAVLQPKSERSSVLAIEEVIKAVQAEVFPYDKNYFRSEANLSKSMGNLNGLWTEINNTIEQKQIARAREVAAMVATARWMYASARLRTETRGMHKHLDYPKQDPNQQHYLVSGGLDKVWVRTQQLLYNSNSPNLKSKNLKSKSLKSQISNPKILKST